MSLWIGDYAKLRNEICYLEFKLTDEQLTDKQRKETRTELDKRLEREGEFKILLNSFEDVDNKILIMKYIEGMTLDEVAGELGYSANYIRNKHAAMMAEINRFQCIHEQLVRFKKNFGIR